MNTDPAAQPSAPPVPAPRRRRWLRRLALGAAIILVVLLCVHLIWYATASADLAQARAASAAAGLSDDPAQVIPPPCADADNAALRYQRAYRLLTKPDSPDPRDPLLDDRLDALIERIDDQAKRETTIADEGAAVLALLDHEDFRRAWGLIAEGASLPRCRFDVDYAAGVNALLPHVSMLRNIGRLGSLRARLLAAQGRGPEAAGQFADLLWLVRQYREEPFLISLLVDLSLESIVLDDLRLALEHPGFAAVDLRRARRALADDQRAAVWKQALQGEFALFGLWTFRHLDQIQPEIFGVNSIAWLTYRSWLGAPLRANDEAAYRRFFAELCLHPVSPGDGVEPSWRHPLTSMLIPSLGHVRSRVDLAAERVAAAQLALLAASGETPVATADLAVERGADGGWTISHLPKPGRSESDQKKLKPWRVPPHR